jgi:hypothetical protein
MAKQSKLEQIAIEQRNRLVVKNDFNNNTNNNNYTENHTKAVSDTETPIHGKGTGEYLDTENGGGSHDVFGVNGGSGGRLNSLNKNEFNKVDEYEEPDTSLNSGQYRID